MTRSFSLIAIFSLFLTACASKPVSYLPTGSDPIVNIESNISEKIKLDTNGKQFAITNLTQSPINVIYKLFWYDKDGVTQLFNGISESTEWQQLWLSPEQKQAIMLIKPTEESANYRLYLRGEK